MRIVCLIVEVTAFHINEILIRNFILQIYILYRSLIIEQLCIHSVYYRLLRQIKCCKNEYINVFH